MRVSTMYFKCGPWEFKVGGCHEDMMFAPIPWNEYEVARGRVVVESNPETIELKSQLLEVFKRSTPAPSRPRHLEEV